MHNHTRKLLTASILTCASMLSIAQESIPHIDADTTGLRSYQLDEVTIISNPKVVSELFEMPGSVTLLSERNIEQMNIVSIKDISSIVSNVYIPDYGSNLITSAYIRGIGSRINSPAVGLSINNMPILDKSAYDIDLIDIARIEILRGPQGTLYGRNTMAGLINIYTHSPFDRNGYRVRAGYGNYSTIDASFDSSWKLAENLALSAAFSYDSHKGYHKNVYTQEYSGNENSLNGRVQLDWKSSQRIKWSLSASIDWGNQDGYPYASFDNNSGLVGEINYNSPAGYDRTVATTGLQMEYRHDNFLLTSTTSYQYLNDKMYMDQDFTPLSIFTLQQEQLLHAISQEVVMRGHENEHWGWTAGIFGSYQDLHVDAPVSFLSDGIDYLIEGTSNAALAAAKLQNPKMPDINIDINNTSLNIDGHYYTPTYSIAAYGQMEAKRIFDSNFSFAIGARLEYEHNALRHNTLTNDEMTGTATIAMGPMTIPIPFATTPLIDGYSHQGNIELLPKYELKYILNKDFMAYASVARGYRSGGYNYQAFSNLIQSQMRNGMITSVGENAADIIRGMMGDSPMAQGIIAQMNGIFAGLVDNNAMNDIEDAIAYKPEYSWNCEIGMRGNAWNNRINAELSLFYIDCYNQQLSTVSGYGRITRNSGRTESYGLEASINIMPINNLLFSAAYGYTHATFKNYEIGIPGEKGYINYTGNHVPFAPAHSFSVSGAYTWELAKEQSITLSAQCNGNGDIYWTEANNASQSFYALLNANISYKWKWLEVNVWGKNLTNTQYNTFYFETTNAQNLAQPNAFVQQGRPITFGANLIFSF